MIIKLSFPGHEGSSNLSQFTGNSRNEFSDCSFRLNDGTEEADAWFVFEEVIEADSKCRVPEGQVYFLAAETSWTQDKFLRPHMEQFFQQFGEVYSCYPIVKGLGWFAPPFLPWMVNADSSDVDSYFSPHDRDLNFFRNLVQVEKSAPLSVICSNRNWTPQHQLRLSFVEFLKSELGDDVSWFGNGVNPIAEKWDGLAPFERTIVLENQMAYGFYSEKVLDPFLSLTETIYAGAPDISAYLPVKESHHLNLLDFAGSLDTIKSLLRKPLSQESHDRLVDGKAAVLGDLHFLNRIAVIAKANASGGETAKSRISYNLKPRAKFASAGSPSKLGTWLRSLKS